MRRTWASNLLLTVSLAASVLPAGATPIRPDIRKLVAEPAESRIQFAPARAGWNGPEATTSESQLAGTAAARLSPAASAREVRAIMAATALPDLRIIAAVFILILLLRYSRKKATSQPEAISNQENAAERLRPAA